MPIITRPHRLPDLSLIGAVKKLGLSTGLQLCLDAGDRRSYLSGQKWLDTSGLGYDFFLGLDGSVAANDPTFTGTPGQRRASTYWSVDGGDFFTYDSANEAWMQSLHKDNAIWSICMWVKPATAANALFGTMGSTSGGTGVRVGISADSTWRMLVYSAGSVVKGDAPLALLNIGSWNFIGISLNEPIGANGLTMHTNGVSELLSATYTSPGSGNAGFTLQIGAGGNSLIPLANGSQIAAFAAWSGNAIGSGGLGDIWTATRRRFGL